MNIKNENRDLDFPLTGMLPRDFDKDNSFIIKSFFEHQGSKHEAMAEFNLEVFKDKEFCDLIHKIANTPSIERFKNHDLEFNRVTDGFKLVFRRARLK